MRRLGVSIYPEKSSVAEILDYLEAASKIGAKRIFSCLLSVPKDPKQIKADFLDIHRAAHKLGYEIVLDVNPQVFKDLGISYKDLSFFHEIEADGIRLDQGFGGAVESAMTYNQYGLQIELNLSNATHMLDTVMDFMPDCYHLLACHNFYPHKYSGLTLDFLERCSLKAKAYGLRTAAFISCANGFGPWPTTEGLPTLEMHRNWPIDVQLKHFVALNYIDDIIISNCFPTKDELAALANVNLQIVNFKVSAACELPEIAKNIVFKEKHMKRGDIPEHMIRSSVGRIKYGEAEIPLFNAPETLKRGDVVLESSLYQTYRGEVQIVLKDMPNSGCSNVVGHISDEEMQIVDGLKPWQRFSFNL
ncbi:DUF871 domain-containing protein [Amygdalobacter nucleatus]|nr:MupG family TIM beta-alpha barrel fold protein [Amygdalobacter nucleatus]MDF0485362.1 MupG family TIM beta-alpha barrel fold protein [Amygdalobacter nucleatus]WEG36774.1 MupG family TIM beta-alpha barrel fold protein [Amygdalobacter nucleatus]